MEAVVHHTFCNLKSVGFIAWCIAILFGGRYLMVGALTNNIPEQFLDSAIVWGNETNGFCVGVLPEDKSEKSTIKQSVRVFILTSKTNAMWNFLLAPTNKLQRLELRNQGGHLITPMRGKQLDGDLPAIIFEEDLPTTPVQVHLKREWLVVSPGRPRPIKEFSIQDVYRIDEQGDYALQVCVAIYQFASDRKSLSRVDLPCVTIRLHLTPILDTKSRLDQTVNGAER